MPSEAFTAPTLQLPVPARIVNTPVVECTEHTAGVFEVNETLPLPLPPIVAKVMVFPYAREAGTSWKAKPV